MSDVIYVEKKLSELFKCKSGNSKYTKGYCNTYSGEYEVYTGSTLQKFAGLSTYDYDKPNLTFTTDGEYAGTLKVLTGKYNVGGHRKILIRQDENLDLDYFAIILQSKFYEKVKKGDVPSVNWDKQLSNIKVKVPINKDGMYDVEKQKEIAVKYKDIENKKNNLLKKIEYLSKVKVEINKGEKINYKSIKISELCNPINGNSDYTKEYCMKHKGNIPVYSGNTAGIFSYINRADYNGKYLTWAKDGLAGYIMIHNGPFCITGHRGILIFNKDIKNIDLNYIRLILEPIFRASIKGRMGINGKNEYTTLNQTMIRNIKEEIKIPIDSKGIFDITKQKEIAQKIATLESIKQDLYNKVLSLVNIHIA